PTSTLFPYTTLFRSDELGLPDQAKGVQVPPLGLGVVRLSKGVGTPCNGIRVGSDELRVVDEAQTVIEFIDQIAEVARNVISEVRSEEHTSELQSRFD